MKKAEGSVVANVSIENTNGELLTVTEVNNGEVMANSSGENSTSSWIIDS